MENKKEEKNNPLQGVADVFSYIYGFAGFIAIILGFIDFFSSNAGFWKGESLSTLHKVYVVFVCVTIYGCLIWSLFTNCEANERYDLIQINFGFPGLTAMLLGIILEAVFTVLNLVVALFWKVPLGQAFSAAGPKMLQILYFSIAVILVSFLAKFIADMIYGEILKDAQKREKESHSLCDPIMLEAVDNGILVDAKQVQAYCKENGVSNKIGIFIKKEYFFEEGLKKLAEADKITAKKASQNNNKKTYLFLYGTKNAARRAEVSEEIEL